MTYTAPNARAFARKQGSLAEKITSELSSIDAEMEALSGAGVSLNSGEILVGNADDAATAVTPSGDVTVSNTGVLTIGAKKVTAAKTAIADGKIFIGGADGAAAEQSLSGDATLAATGALTIADSVLDGSNVANTSPDNVIGAIPVLYRIAVEDASANNDITSTHKFLVTDFWFVGGATPGVADDTVQLLNGTNAISEAVAKTTDANCLVRATQLDQSTGMVAAGGTIRITSVKNTNVAGTAYVMGIRVA
jgi:hypothetical protein